MWAAQTRQPKPMLTTRKGLTSNHSFELEWSRALLAEQKCCCPQRHHVCDLWPQKPFSQSGLKGKEMKWCKKTPKPYLFILVSGPWSSNPGAVTHLATRQDTKAAAVVHHHLCLCSCLLAALLLVSVNVALQQPEAFVSFSMVLLSACGLWLVLFASEKFISSNLLRDLATAVASVKGKLRPHSRSHCWYFHCISQDGKYLKRMKFRDLMA